MANYLANLNGANATFGGYIKHLAKAKISTIGLQIATTALNAAISFGIGLLISYAFEGLMYIINYEENLIKKSKEAADAISTLSDKLKETQKLVKDSAERFAKLAQGVDLFSGKNISLTSDEYEEFLDLSNQLAETFPSFMLPLETL